MNLARYLDETETTLDAFAERIGVSNKSVVHRYATGKRVPRPRIMAEITRVTAGKVTANDFYPAPAA